MRSRSSLLLVLAAAAAGGGVGYALRAGTSSGPVRPRAVEAVLKAVDKDDAAALARALDDAGPAASYGSPWREEVLLGRAVASRDPAAVWAFATGGPPMAPRARALLW